MWDKYRKQFSYAKDITYEQIMDSIKTLLKYKAWQEVESETSIYKKIAPR